MKTEELKKLGLTEEQIQEIHRLNGLDVNGLKEEKENLLAEVSGYKERLEKQSKELESLSGKSLTEDEYRERVQKMKDEFDEEKSKLEESLKETKFLGEVDKALLQAGVRDVDIAKAAFDLTSMSMEEGTLQGFDKQLEEVKEKHAYLFKESDGASGTGGSLGNVQKQKKEEEDAFVKGLLGK